MPYVVRGKCVYKKGKGGKPGKKVGCTKGSVKKYLAALHMHADESLDRSLTKEELEEIIQEGPVPGSRPPPDEKWIELLKDPIVSYADLTDEVRERREDEGSWPVQSTRPYDPSPMLTYSDGRKEPMKNYGGCVKMWAPRLCAKHFKPPNETEHTRLQDISDAWRLNLNKLIHKAPDMLSRPGLNQRTLDKYNALKPVDRKKFIKKMRTWYATEKTKGQQPGYGKIGVGLGGVFLKAYDNAAKAQHADWEKQQEYLRDLRNKRRGAKPVRENIQIKQSKLEEIIQEAFTDLNLDI